MTLYGAKIDFSEPIRKLGDASHIKSGCAAPRVPLCATGPCDNDGRCADGWNSFSCDCSQTRFAGPTCNKRERNEGDLEMDSVYVDDADSGCC